MVKDLPYEMYLNFVRNAKDLAITFARAASQLERYLTLLRTILYYFFKLFRRNQIYGYSHSKLWDTPKSLSNFVKN